MEHRIIFAGFGGQGLLTLGKLLAACAMEQGKHVTYFPSYGSEVRGGTANCRVVVGDNPIASPLVEEASIMLIMNELSMTRFVKTLKPGGLMVLNSSLSPLPEDVDNRRILAVPATELADEIGSTKVANMVMLGAMNEVEKLVDFDWIEKRLVKMLGEKGAKLMPLNMKAIEAGRKLAKEWMKEQTPAST